MMYDANFPEVDSKLVPGLDYVELQRWKWYADRGLYHIVPRLFTNKFVIYYNTSLPPTSVQNAISTAVNIYSSYYNISSFINVGVSWIDLSVVNPNLLGQGKPAQMCLHPNSSTFKYVLIPSSLYVQLTGQSNCPGAPNAIHIMLSINNNPAAPWYTGVDGKPPNNQIDLMTVVMHELTHGMGFVSGVNDASCAYPSSPDGYIYDWFALKSLTGWPASFLQVVSNPCTSNAAPLSGGLLTFQGTVGGSSNSNFPIYLPPVFALGSSISHVDTGGMNVNLMMGYSIGSGKAFHDIGGFVWSVMATFGYNMKNCAGFTGGKSNADCVTCISNFCEWCYQDSFCGDSQAPNFWGTPGTCSASNGWLNTSSWCGNGGTTLSTTTLAAATTTLGCISKVDILTGAVTCGASSLMAFFLMNK